MGRFPAPFSTLVMVSVAMFATACGRICVGGTPVEEITCNQRGAGAFSSATGSGPAAPLVLAGAGTPISGDGFTFLLVGGYLNLQVSSSFPGGAATYTLPSPAVTIEASVILPDAGNQYEKLHVASGTLIVAAANQNLLDASGSLTLADGSGRTFTVTDVTVHVACAYDQTTCR